MIRSRPGHTHTRAYGAVQGLGGSTLAKVLVRPGQGSEMISLPHVLKVRATPTREGAASTGRVAEKRGAGRHHSWWSPVGTKELACGGQAFIATSLFDPSMSALPIIPKQNSVSVGLFTH